MLVFCIHVKFFIKAAEECTKQGEAQLKDMKGAPSVAGPDKVCRQIILSPCSDFIFRTFRDVIIKLKLYLEALHIM